MSIIQQQAALGDAWRTINIDALEEDSPLNFDTRTLRPPVATVTDGEVRELTGQVRQLLRAGDSAGALRGCLEMPVYEGSDAAKEAALAMVVEVLQSIKASEMSPLLRELYAGDNGSALLDVLMKYLYKGMASSAAPSASSASRSPARGAPRSMTPQQTGGFSQIGARPGGGSESAGAAMSVLLSWHEKVVEVAGLGCIQRTMTDWRRV